MPAYGLVESGRLWQLAVEQWLFSTFRVESVPGLVQLFVLRDDMNEIKLLMAKVVDDFLLAGHHDAISELHKTISLKFKIGRFVTGSEFVFNRLSILKQSDGSVRLSMQEYFNTIEPIPLSLARCRQPLDKVTEDERKEFLALAGLTWLGHGIQPPASNVASHLQHCGSDLRIDHLVLANKCLEELRHLEPDPLYPVVRDISCNASYLAFSDAIQGKYSYGQTGYLSGITFHDDCNTCHLLDWHSSKQSRISFSSAGAEILAAATSAERSIMMSMAVGFLFGGKHFPLTLTVDSHGLYSTMTTLHKGKDYRLQPTVSLLRDSFESNEITTVQWIPGGKNLADALAKRNFQLFRLLNSVCVAGMLPDHLLSHARCQISRDLTP